MVTGFRKNAKEKMIAMAYNELIKSFSRIRVYLRSFYIYGFQHRDEFTQKSARSYDNERRRVESWLGNHMSFRQDRDGKRVFLSVDSRAIPGNPLYKAFRAKSFTERDISLHFHILDILKVSGGLSITELMDELADRLLEFDSGELPDESTVRKKLREYAALGLIDIRKRGRETLYARMQDCADLSGWETAVAFFSEAAPLGVIGSFIQDRLPETFPFFRFKHHYILNALDSEVLHEALLAIGERRLLSFSSSGQHTMVMPLKIYIGTQTGRQYLLACTLKNERFSFYRLDLMDHLKTGETFEWPEEQKKRQDDFCAHAWGITGNNDHRLEHIEMMIYAAADEGHIVERLKRESRCGRIEQVDDTHWRFAADVYEAMEMLPWLRTFTGRVTALHCSDESVVNRFWHDFSELAQMYGGEEHAVS